MAPRMMGAVLDALADATGRRGAAVIHGADPSVAGALGHVTGSGRGGRAATPPAARLAMPALPERP